MLMLPVSARASSTRAPRAFNGGSAAGAPWTPRPPSPFRCRGGCRTIGSGPPPRAGALPAAPRAPRGPSILPDAPLARGSLGDAVLSAPSTRRQTTLNFGKVVSSSGLFEGQKHCKCLILLCFRSLDRANGIEPSQWVQPLTIDSVVRRRRANRAHSSRSTARRRVGNWLGA